MKLKKVLSAVLAAVCAASLLVGCGSSAATATEETAASTASGSSDHPVITMNAPYRNAAYFLDVVHKRYPEVNLEVLPYNGANTTSYFTDA